MNRKPLVALLLCAMIGLVAKTGHSQVVYQNNFDQHTSEIVYTDDELDADWGEPVWENGVDEGRVTIVTGADAYGGTGSALAVAYPAGEHGVSGTGAQWRLELNNEYEELFSSYRVKFKSGFDFVRGGKLPGLGGGDTPTGSDQANGVDGWTGRMMWRTDFEGVSGQPQQTTSHAISYAKYISSGFNNDGAQEDKEYWLDDDTNRTSIQSGVWYQITQRIKMNDPGAANGIIQTWLDGDLVYDQQDVDFRQVPELKIDIFYFSTFFGGGSSWRTSQDETVFFDDFVISLENPMDPSDPVDPPSEPVTRRYPSDYSTVQAAINAAVPGDAVVIVGRAIENVVVDKSLTITGVDSGRIVAANPELPCVQVESSDVHILRLKTVFGSEGVKVLPGNTSVFLDQVEVRRTTGAGVEFGVGCHDSRFRDSSVAKSGGSGVFAEGCNNLFVRNNDNFSNDEDGFRFVNVTGLGLFDNLSRFNDGAGYVIDGSELFGIRNVAFRNDLDGFALTGHSNMLLLSEASRNRGSGFFLGSADGNAITRNESFDNDMHGFQLSPASSNNTLSDNDAYDNDEEGYLDEGSGNQLSGNAG